MSRHADCNGGVLVMASAKDYELVRELTLHGF
jgi:hypothetical protein